MPLDPWPNPQSLSSLSKLPSSVALPWGILEAHRIERSEYLHLAKLRLVVLIAQFANV